MGEKKNTATNCVADLQAVTDTQYHPPYHGLNVCFSKNSYVEALTCNVTGDRELELVIQVNEVIGKP